jgi:hypothetical protein
LEIQRKLRVIADIIERIDAGHTTLEDLRSITQTGDIKVSELESLLILGREFGFVDSDEGGRFSTTKSGRSFERYMTELDKLEFGKMPNIDRGVGLKLCATLPPRWSRQIKDIFLDVIMDTIEAQRTIVEDARNWLLIITPFIDVAVFQLVLKDVQKKTVDVTIITSEPSLSKQYISGRNFELEKLRSLIKSRFRSGRVYFLQEESTIAHAKVWCSDRSLFVTSANIRSDSTTDNLEIGIYVDDSDLFSVMRDLASRFLKLGGLKCILKVD